jgi:hypothetical protein
VLKLRFFYGRQRARATTDQTASTSPKGQAP